MNGHTKQRQSPVRLRIGKVKLRMAASREAKAKHGKDKKRGGKAANSAHRRSEEMPGGTQNGSATAEISVAELGQSCEEISDGTAHTRADQRWHSTAAQRHCMDLIDEASAKRIQARLSSGTAWHTADRPGTAARMHGGASGGTAPALHSSVMNAEQSMGTAWRRQTQPSIGMAGRRWETRRQGEASTGCELHRQSADRLRVASVKC